MANPATDYSQWRRTTAGGIKFHLLDGPKIVMNYDGTSVTEVYLLRAQDAAAFAAESMPAPYVFGFYIIQPPYRAMPGNSYIVTKQLDFEGFEVPYWDPLSADTGAHADDYAKFCKVTITYETGKAADTRNEQDPTTFLEHSMQVEDQFFEIDGVKLYYSEDGDVLPSLAGAGKPVPMTKLPGAHKRFPLITHNLRWPFVLSPDWDKIFQLMGTVNRTSKPLFKNAAAETVLFAGVSGNQKWVWRSSSAQAQPWSLDFRFAQRAMKIGTTDITWNHYFLPAAESGGAATGKWVKPFYWSGGAPLVGTKKYFYETSDLYDVFKAA